MTFNRIDSVLYSFAPFTIIVLLNIAIVYKFVKAKLETARAGTTESTNQALSKSAMRGTAILITVSVTFVLLTSPANIMYSITHNPNQILQAVAYILACMNHSINAVLYCIVGSRFRQEVANTLCCRTEKHRHNSQWKNSDIKSSVIHSDLTTTASPT